MKTPQHPHDNREVGLAWYLVPLWAAVVAGTLVLSTYWPALLADGTQPDDGAAAVSLAPAAGSDPSVPSASTVFQARTWEVSEHVQQF